MIKHTLQLCWSIQKKVDKVFTDTFWDLSDGQNLKQLFDLVLSTPMTKLSKQLEVSDVGLRKICIKNISKVDNNYLFAVNRIPQWLKILI